MFGQGRRTKVLKRKVIAGVDAVGLEPDLAKYPDGFAPPPARAAW